MGHNYPFVLISFSLADLIGVGTSVNISILLGQNQNEEANNHFTWCVPGNFSDRDSDRRGFVFHGAAPYAPAEAVVHRKGHRKRGPPGGGKPRRVMWGRRDVRPVGTGVEAVYPQRGENAPLPLGGEETNGKESTAFFPVFQSVKKPLGVGARRREKNTAGLPAGRPACSGRFPAGVQQNAPSPHGAHCPSFAFSAAPISSYPGLPSRANILVL